MATSEARKLGVLWVASVKKGVPLDFHSVVSLVQNDGQA